MRAARAALLAAPLLAGLVAGTAHATALDPDDPGAAAQGRAGAYTARADDGSALFLNVAGLAGQPGLRLRLEGMLRSADVRFRRRSLDVPGAPPDANPPRYPEARTNDGLSVTPGVIVAWGSSGGRVGLALGYTEAVAAEVAFPQGGTSAREDPQRYVATSGRLVWRRIAAGAGLRLARGLSLGLAFDARLLHLSRSAAFSGAGPLDGPEDFQVDVPLAYQASAVSFGGRLGLLLRPHQALAIGLQAGWASPARFAGPIAAGTSARPPAGYAALVVSGGEGRLALAQPVEVRGGVRYVGTRFDVELDASYLGWGRAGRPTVLPQAGIAQAIGDTLPTETWSLGGWPLFATRRDTWSVRLGGDVQLMAVAQGCLHLRAGYAFERAATRPSEVSVADPELDQHVVAAGLEAQLSGVRLQLAYQRHILATSDVGGALGQPALLVSDSTRPRPVGLGRLYVGVDRMLLAAEVTFELPGAATRR